MPWPGLGLGPPAEYPSPLNLDWNYETILKNEVLESIILDKGLLFQLGTQRFVDPIGLSLPEFTQPPTLQHPTLLSFPHDEPHLFSLVKLACFSTERVTGRSHSFLSINKTTGKDLFATFC